MLREKGWLGHKETTLHHSEGPIWMVRWRGRLIAWANDRVSPVSLKNTLIYELIGRDITIIGCEDI